VRFLWFRTITGDLQAEFHNSSFSQNDTIAKSMAKGLAVKQGRLWHNKRTRENLLNGLFACKTPMFSFSKTNFHHDACGG
jgi:DNA mismatch repair protein MutL